MNPTGRQGGGQIIIATLCANSAISCARFQATSPNMPASNTRSRLKARVRL